MVKRKNKHRIINVLVSFYERSLNMDDYLASVYYDPKRSGGFGGVDRLYKDVCRNLTMAKISPVKRKEDYFNKMKIILIN